MSAQPRPRPSLRHQRRAAAARIQKAEPQPLVINIPREHVEAGRIDLYAETLDALLASPQTARNFRNLVFIGIGGYGEDSRALYQIPEVRDFLSRLDTAFPYLFWFLNDEEPSFLATLLLCLVGRASDDANTHFADLEALRSFMTTHYEAVEELGALLRLRADEITSRQEQVGEYFKRYEGTSRVVTTEIEFGAPAFSRLLKFWLPSLGAALTAVAWLIPAAGYQPFTPLNVLGPIAACLGLGYRLIPDSDLQESPDLSTRSKAKLVSSMLAGTAIAVANQLLITRLLGG